MEDTEQTEQTGQEEQQDVQQEEHEEHEEQEEQQEEHEEHEEQQTFGREYVQQLRRNSAGYRQRAKAAEQRLDETSRRLFALEVERIGVLVDPSELPYDEELLADPEKLASAVEELVTKKPYLRRRVADGDIGQHASKNERAGVSLAGLLRAGA